jgi:WD40 repeat protein
LRVWTRDGELEATLSCAGTPWGADFNARGSLLASGNWDQKIHLFEWPGGEELPALEGHTATVWSVDFHPTDPALLVSAASDGTVRLWDVLERRCLITFEELLDSEALSASFSADGTRIVASNSLGTAVVWDLTYYARHIAGQVDHQLRRLEAELGDRIRGPELRAWVAETLNSPAQTSSSIQPQ